MPKWDLKLHISDLRAAIKSTLPFVLRQLSPFMTSDATTYDSLAFGGFLCFHIPLTLKISLSLSFSLTHTLSLFPSLVFTA